MHLKWEVDKEYGFLDIIEPREYDGAYFEKYVKYSATPMGRALTSARVAFISKWYAEKGDLLDVGVGSGQFLTARPGTFGYDVNKTAVDMLKRIGKYADPFDRPFPAYSFWDSFEHIKEHSLLAFMEPGAKVFISLPIFRDIYHALRAKHFRRDEHYWYFTSHGLVRYMADYGFSCLEIDNFEMRLGREDILSFAFTKR